jgi:hypothetical protein
MEQGSTSWKHDNEDWGDPPIESSGWADISHDRDISIDTREDFTGRQGRGGHGRSRRGSLNRSRAHFVQQSSYDDGPRRAFLSSYENAANDYSPPRKDDVDSYRPERGRRGQRGRGPSPRLSRGDRRSKFVREKSYENGPRRSSVSSYGEHAPQDDTHQGLYNPPPWGTRHNYNPVREDGFKSAPYFKRLSKFREQKEQRDIASAETSERYHNILRAGQDLPGRQAYSSIDHMDTEGHGAVQDTTGVHPDRAWLISPDNVRKEKTSQPIRNSRSKSGRTEMTDNRDTKRQATGRLTPYQTPDRHTRSPSHDFYERNRAPQSRDTSRRLSADDGH